MSAARRENSLHNVAGKFRRRLSWFVLTVGAARLVVAAVLLFAIGAGADWLFHIPWGWRALPLLIFLAALAVLADVSMRRPLRERWSDRQILAWLDGFKPDSSMLLDRYELAEEQGIEERNDAHGRQLLDEAIGAISGDVDAGDLLRRSFSAAAARRWWTGAAAAMLLIILAAAMLPLYTRVAAVRFFNPLSRMRWPHRTNIALDKPPGGWSVPQGEALKLRATVSGVEIPQQLDLVYRVAGGQWVRERMPVSGNQARFTLPEILEPLDFHLSGGDDTTDTIHVDVIRRPSLEKILVRVQSPAYSGIPERTSEGGDVEGLEGALAHIDFTCSTPLKSALITFEGEKEQTLPITGGRDFSTEFMLTKSTAYAITLIGRSGFQEARPERYEVRVQPAAPPEAHIVTPEADIESTANATYKVEFNARDDFELAKVEFLYRLDDGPLIALSDRITGPIAVHCKTTSATFNWDLSRMGIPQKDTVNLEYFVRATNTNPTGRGIAESAHHRIRVLKPSLYRESLLLMARSLVDEALLAERNQRQAYQAGKKFLSGAGTGDENDPTWQEMTSLQSGAFDAARAMSTQLSTLLQRAADNRLQTEFMSARLSQIAELLRGVIDNQHAYIAKQLDAAAPRDASQSTPAATKARRMQLLTAMNETETGQKRAALQLQQILFLVFDWNDLQSAAVSGLRLYEQQDECSHQTAAIAPVFIGKDIRDLSDADQERMIDLGKAQRVIYDAESVLEGHLEEILTKAERQKRQSIRVPIYAAYADLRNNRVQDRLLHASQAIENNQPADILNEQKTALEALRVVKVELEAAGEPEKLAVIPLSTAVTDVDVENTKKQPNVEETVAPPPMIAVDKQGIDPLTTSMLSAGDALTDLVRRSEYLAGHDSTGDLPRFERLRFGRLLELGTAADQAVRQAQSAAAKANEAFIQAFLTGLDTDVAGAVQLIGEKDIGPPARQISADAAAGLSDVVQMLASQRAVKQMTDEHDHQGGIDPFKRPYVLQAEDLAKTTDLIVGLLELRVRMLDAGRALHRLETPPKPGDSLSELQAARRKRLSATREESAARWAAIKKDVAAVSDANRAKVAGSFGDLLGGDITAAISPPAGQEGAAVTQLTGDVQKLAQTIQGLRDLMDARGELAPAVAVNAGPPPREVARMTQAQYDKMMSLASLKDRVTHATQLPPAVRDALVKSLSGKFPPEQERFLAAYVNSILTAAKEDKP